jgi:hypothetical protein
MNPCITEVTPHTDHTLTLTFANGETRHFDLAPYLHFPCFEPLKQTAFFLLARCDHGTVAWPQNIDFDPDTLYLESQPVPQTKAA